MPRTAKLLAIILVLGVGCSDGAEAARPRKAVLAGTWYPADRDELAESVDSYIAKAKSPTLEGRVIALIAPHAGHRYSGPTAGHAFATLRKGDYDTVVLLAPSHHAAYRGASIAECDAYATPLGNVPLDGPACEKLLKHKLFQRHPTAHRMEHSIEIELPFLQRRLGDFKLVPILVSSLRDDEHVALAKAIREAAPPRTLFVASSDFTHYGARFGYTPFTENIPANLRKLDMGAVDCALKCDAAAFRKYCDDTGATICGRAPVAVLLSLLSRLPEKSKGTLLHYSTSGALTGDWAHTVSYAAVAFTVAQAKATGPLTETEKKALIAIARRTLESVVRTGRKPDAKDFAALLTPTLKKDGAVFVTLNKKGKLRGCIGSLAAHEPLVRNVIRHAENAAVRDWRFPKVSADELADIKIEISYLTPARRIKSLDEMMVGRHGLIIEKGGRRAVFLPQVAPEQGWDRETTAKHLCLKAGLPLDAWKQGATLEVFEAHVFHEE